MRQLADSFHPITASPFQNDAVYCEVAPCDALRPFIRCFWGTKTPITVSLTEPVYSPVIPDACMDILFRTDYTHNTYSANFCPIDEHAFFTSSGTNKNVTATFGIRFYAWSAVLFADGDFRGERFYSAEEFSKELTAQLTPVLFEIPNLLDKIAFAEKILLEKLNLSKMNNDLLNSIDFMITTCGRGTIAEVCSYASVSERKLERLFASTIGVSPKAFASLVRYQLLWQEMLLSPHFDALDAVEKYGYTDQPHLLRDFKKHHLMPPKEAIRHAMSDFYKTTPP